MKWLLRILVVIITSLYIFPVEFSALPSINTKMMMAVLGVVVFVINSILHRDQVLPRKLLTAGLCALLVSFVGLISVLFNGTNDFSYASYFVSFAVWAAAAYFVVNCIRVVHGQLSVMLVCKYLIAVAIGQCIVAVMIDQIPAFRNAVNSTIVGFASMYSAGDGLEKAGRLYGIGAALDVAGTRFCAILSILGIMTYNSYQAQKKTQMFFYLFLSVVLIMFGSIISRTTILGVLFLILYFTFATNRSGTPWGFWGIILTTLCALVALVVILYNSTPFFQENLRFAFEGFFNYFETGEWRLRSTDILRDMYVFPESLKTWVIGDGYFDEPYNVDPYYVGESRDYGMFYMGTDVGYLRFIYYFGVFGLAAFMFYFIMNMQQCIADFPKCKWVFIALLMMNFIVWFKVATDIFCLFALFLCISKEDNDAYEDSLSDQLDI